MCAEFLTRGTKQKQATCPTGRDRGWGWGGELGVFKAGKTFMKFCLCFMEKVSEKCKEHSTVPALESRVLTSKCLEINTPLRDINWSPETMG